MQSLLTRAGRARNCGCNSCIGVAKTIVRRSTTGAEVKVSYRHAFTTLYTSIFATAAVVDAKYKDDRRKHLDDQISEAKDAVARLQLQNATAEVEVQPSVLERVVHDGGSYGDPTTLDRVEAPPSLIASTNEENSSTSRVFEQYGAEHWDIFHGTNIGRTLRALKRSDYRMLEKLLKASAECDQPLVLGSTPDQWTFNITQLVDYLLLEHDRMSAQHQAPAKSPLREAIDRLQSSGYPNFRSQNDHPTTTKDFSSRLSKRMARDIASATDAAGIIERICYNLLTSQQPLTIHTYNTLIVHLNKTGYHKVAQCVLQSHFAHFRRHHPQSEAVILNHDREFGNYAAAYRNVNVILKNSSAYLTRGGDYLLDSMVRAFAGFRDMKDALVVFCHGLSMGLTIGPQALFQLIGLCIWKLDRILALELVRAFTNHPQQLESMLTAEPAAQSILLHQMNYLLDVANLWRHPSKLHAQLKSHGLDPERFRRFRMMVTVHDIQRQANQISRMTRRLQQILSEVDAPKYKRMSRADAMEHVSERAGRVADDFDFHLDAAMPSSWVQRDLKALESLKYPRRQRRVWTVGDYDIARANLRLAVLSKEVADGGRQLANCSLELRRIDPEGAMRQGRQSEPVYAGNVRREPVAAAGLG